MVPLFLLASLLIAVESGFFNGYLRLFQRNTYTTFLSTLGAVYALAFLTMQAIRTVLWWRYRPYAVPAGPLPRVTVIIPAYNEGAMVEKALYSVAAATTPKTFWRSSASTTAPGTIPGTISSEPDSATPN